MLLFVDLQFFSLEYTYKLLTEILRRELNYVVATRYYVLLS